MKDIKLKPIAFIMICFFFTFLGIFMGKEAKDREYRKQTLYYKEGETTGSWTIDLGYVRDGTFAQKDFLVIRVNDERE